MLTFGSLFAGIGGIDLGLERAGMIVKWQVEIDPFCRAVLRKHWPDVPIYGDIRELNVDELPAVDLVCGGFPCQPFSCAGKRRGKDDDRYLWPEMFRIIKALRPRWVLGENVAGIVNLAFDTVLSDLESEGYETGAFIIPACAVGAPHRRDRVWIVAYSRCSLLPRSKFKRTNENENKQKFTNKLERSGKVHENVAYTKCPGFYEGCFNKTRQITRCSREQYKDRKIKPRLGGMLDGLSNWLDNYRWPTPYGCEQYEWEPPRVTTEKVPYRRQRLQALGNAVVPQIVEVIGKAILEADRMWKEEKHD